MKEKKCQSGIIYLAKVSFRYEGGTLHQKKIGNLIKNILTQLEIIVEVKGFKSNISESRKKFHCERKNLKKNFIY